MNSRQNEQQYRSQQHITQHRDRCGFIPSWHGDGREGTTGGYALLPSNKSAHYKMFDLHL